MWYTQIKTTKNHKNTQQNYSNENKKTRNKICFKIVIRIIIVSQLYKNNTGYDM